MYARLARAGLIAAALALAISPLLFSNRTAEADELFGVDLGVNLPWFRVGTDAAVFEAPRYGSDGRLYVRSDDGWLVYRGADYQTIVRSNPDLGGHAGVTLLGTRIGTQAGVDLDAPPPPAWRTYVRAPGVVYEASSLEEPARLFVTRDGREYVYVGRDFDTIVSAHPDLRDVEGFRVIERRISEVPLARLRTDFESTAIVDTAPQVHIVYEPDTVVVETWSWVDGKWKQETFRGATIDEIMTTNPRANEVLAIWMQAEGAADTTPATHRPGGFGVMFTSTETSIEGTARTGLLVQEVHTGSPAAEIGLKTGDILLSLNGEAVGEADVVINRLDTIEADASLELEGVRSGNTIMLTR